MKHIGTFEGVGGFSLAARWMGWETIAWVENNEYCQTKLKKHFPNAAGYGDIRTTDFTKYRGGAASLLADSHAKISVPQTAMQLELWGSDQDFGSSLKEQSGRPVRDGWLLRIRQCSLEKDSKLSYRIFPKSGMMYNGNVYQREHLASLTKESGCLLLPTPMASDNRDRGTYLKTSAITRRVENGKQIGLSMLFNGKPCPHCVTQIMGFPNGWLKTE